MNDIRFPAPQSRAQEASARGSVRESETHPDARWQ
jgi:hypothetical protein